MGRIGSAGLNRTLHLRPWIGLDTDWIFSGTASENLLSRRVRIRVCAIIFLGGHLHPAIQKKKRAVV